MLKVVADRSMDQLWVPFRRYRGPYAITMPCGACGASGGPDPAGVQRSWTRTKQSPATGRRHRAPFSESPFSVPRTPWVPRRRFRHRALSVPGIVTLGTTHTLELAPAATSYG